MDIEAIKQKIDEFTRLRDRESVKQEIKRMLALGGIAGAAQAIHSNQIYQGQANASAGGLHQAMGNQMLGGAHAPYASQSISGENVTEGILKTFELRDKATFEFATATAQLLGARIRASWSPNQSPRCSPRKGIVWQIFNHNWMLDVQWVEGPTGGSEDQWTKRFAELADLISEARANGDKQYGDEPQVPPLTMATLRHAQQMLGQMQQAGAGNGHIANQQALQNIYGAAQNTYGAGVQNVSSQSGFAQGGGHAGARGGSAQDDPSWGSLGVGP